MGTPLRVALVTNAPPTHGMGKPVRLLAAALRRRDSVAPDIWMLDTRTQTVLRNQEVVLRLRPWTRLKPLAWVRLGRALRLDAYDVVHLTNQTLAFLAPRVAVPTVLTVWDLIEREEPQERGGGLVARYLYRGIPNVTELIAVSETTRAAIARWYGPVAGRATVIPPAASEIFAPIPDVWHTVGGRSFLARTGMDPLRPRVVYVGSEHPRKNVPRLVAAVAEVRRGVPDLEFVKIGGAGLTAGRAAFLDAVDRFALWPILRRVDEANDDELVYWYHAATVLAFPTLREGFGLPPLEALACGTPVVTSNRSSLPEVVGDAAVLVDPDDVGSLARGLTRVLTDGVLRAQLRERGLARAGQFTWERSAARTEEVYRRAVARG